MTCDRADPPIAPSAQRALRRRAIAEDGFRQLNYVCGLPPLEVEERCGRQDDAPVATRPETLLTTLGSCLGTRIHANAALSNIVVRSLELEVQADVVTSPMWDPLGRELRPIGFEAIQVSVHIEADTRAEARRALVAHAARWSLAGERRTMHKRSVQHPACPPSPTARGSALPPQSRCQNPVGEIT
jgi:OsmC-like protein